MNQSIIELEINYNLYFIYILYLFYAFLNGFCIYLCFGNFKLNNTYQIILFHSAFLLLFFLSYYLGYIQILF